MDHQKLSIVKNIFHSLTDMELVMLHFAGDMSMWGFSSAREDAQLHVQCSYRFTCEDQTLLCRRDIHTIVNREKFGTLLHTERDLLAMYLFPLRVKEVAVQGNQDLTISFQDDFSLHIYADLPSMDEQWRFWIHPQEPEEWEQQIVAADGKMKIQKIRL